MPKRMFKALGKKVWGSSLDYSGSGYGPVAGCCGYGDEYLCFTEIWWSSWLAERLSAPHDAYRFMEYVNTIDYWQRLRRFLLLCSSPLLLVLLGCVERLATNRHRVFVTLPWLEMDISERRFEICVILHTFMWC